MTRKPLKLFPYGYAPLLLLVVSVASGGWILLHPAQGKHAAIRLWTFTVLHAEPYKNIMPEIEARFPGKKVDVQLVHVTAVSSRLRAAFWADLDVPDLVEVEISKSGAFFRGPLENVGFVDLMPRLRETGYLDKIVPTRLTPYTNRGRIFGLPHDIHPVMLAYRRDLIEEIGVDVSKLTTWDEFIAMGRKLTQPGKRYMIMLSDASIGHFETMLFQRDGGYFDRNGNLTIDNEIAVETMKWYVPLVAGPNRIAMDLGSGNVLTQSVEQGYILFYISPDWYSKYLERETPRMAGKMALMPLPAVRPGGRRTSTLGGTMMAITKKCENPEMAWSILEKLYLDTEFLAERFRQTNILPAIKDAWKHPAFDEKRPYWSDQRIGRMYAELGNDVPPQFSSPHSDSAKAKMGKALTACVAYYKTNGDKGFEEFIRRELKTCADQVRVLMGRNPF